MNREPRQDTNIIIDAPNTEKQEHINRNEQQTDCKKKQEMNSKNLKRTMYEKKITLPSIININWKTLKAETEKIYLLLTHISTKNITELNELIYAGAK